MTGPIRVVLHPDRSVVEMGPEGLVHWAESELRRAGIPLDSGGALTSGKIERFDDPEDFGATIWEWRP
jgi:hypothetical protein